MRIPYTSLAAFKAKASLLESLLNLKGRRRSLELLAQLSGYASYHEVSHTDFVPGPMPTVGQVATQLQAAHPETSTADALRVAEALGLHAPPGRPDKKHKTEEEQEFDALYVTKAPVDKKALSKFEFSKLEGGMMQFPSFDPSEQAKALREARAPLFYANSPDASPSHPDLPDLSSEVNEMQESYVPNDEDLSEWWVDHVSNVLYPKYVGQDAPSVLTTPEEKLLSAFWENPSEKAAKTHPILSKIPDVARLAALWRRHHLKAFTRPGPMLRSRFTVLVGEVDVPRGEPWSWAPADAQIRWSIAFAESQAAELEDDDYMNIWEYSACFMLTEKGATRSKPIALMTGSHIVPFSDDGDYQGVDSEHFADMMDSHSAMLNDVWKVLQYQYFAAQGFADVEHFVEDRPGYSFTVASLELAPELRGKGLTPTLLNLFTATVARCPASELDAGWQDSFGLPDRSEDASTRIELGSPVVLILPVEGTEPHRQPLGPASVLFVRSPLKVEGTNKDPKKELRKEKLTAHFLAMADQVEAHIVVYDPWEFPIT